MSTEATSLGYVTGPDTRLHQSRSENNCSSSSVWSLDAEIGFAQTGDVHKNDNRWPTYMLRKFTQIGFLL